MNKKEEGRIKSVYDKRCGDAVIYSSFNPGHVFLAQQLERQFIRLLVRHRIVPLGDKRILDVGCGGGWRLRDLVKYGAKGEHMHGIDLFEDAIAQARRINPGVDFRCGNAEALPFQSKSFDVVMQFVVFTSVLETDMKHNMAEEMLRVLKPDGLILWYDYFLSKPTNRDVRGIGKHEIKRLFPDCSFHFSKTTLAPPIGRALAPYSFLLCYLLEKLPFLRTYYLVAIKKGRSN